MSLALPGALFRSLPMLIKDGEILICFDVGLNVSFDAKFLVGSFTTGVPFETACDLMWNVTFAMHMSAGPMSCSDPWDQLELPSLGVEGAQGDTQPVSMAFGARNVAAADTEQATQQKDLYVSIAQGVAYSLSAMFWAAAWCAAFRYWRRSTSCKTTPLSDL